ncbi:PREDICTED: uncharacterized protein LOC104788983 [Camelina sativa]|uniref:Uncharacterized protein LOC104788983 n=1 Tax=Camelina sativa TaxID=90675 RepID=A0ABM0ZB31_CAMSA|nr:PREDICTED: uncharacterized protein LOC104788983 [Camelina sativa]
MGEEDGDDLYVTLKDKDSLIVAVIPKQPAGAETFEDDDDDDDDLVNFYIFDLISLSSHRQQAGGRGSFIYYFLRNKLKLPDNGTFLFKSEDVGYYHLMVYLGAYCPPVGTIFLLGTGFSIILLNLGKRQPGDVRATHSIKTVVF